MSPVAGLPHAGKVALACGIGNPDVRYATTRHNAGVWCVHKLAAAAGIKLTAVAKLPALAAKGADGMRLLVPTTYMNESGRAVGPLAKYFKIEPTCVLVVHDEIDLNPGVARFKFGGGHAGHNGLRDIIAALGTRDFWRLRIGVGHPRAIVREEASSREPAAEVIDWVLSTPLATERASIDMVIDSVVAHWASVASGDMEVAMQAVHKVQG